MQRTPRGQRKESIGSMEEMNEFESKPGRTFWRDWGVYCALALCLAIIGAAVAITSLPEKEQAQQPIREENVARASQATQNPLFEDRPVIAQPSDAPVIRIVPEVEPTAEPAPTQPAEAAVAQAPSKSSSGDRKAQAPVSGKIVWGYAADKLIYSKTLDQWTTHKAVDIGCPEGTAVKCVLGGTVEKVYTDDQLGRTVIVKHSSGRKTLYANLNDTIPVQEGDKVNAGTVLGTVGKTALSECALEGHLHFAFFVDGKAVDPATKVKLG